MSSKYQEDLSHIRSMMEKSSTFISLSGLSGIVAGVVALTGAVGAYFTLKLNGLDYFSNGELNYPKQVLQDLFWIASAVLVLAIAGGIYFTVQKSKKKEISFWNKATKNVLTHLAVPLLTGGIFCLTLVYHNIDGLIAPAMLVFYGLALVNASKYTFGDIRWLGYLEIFVGLISAFFIEYGLLFWTFGFGILHIIYGIIMFNKYDLK